MFQLFLWLKKCGLKGLMVKVSVDKALLFCSVGIAKRVNMGSDLRV